MDYSPNGFPMAVKWTEHLSDQILELCRVFNNSETQGFALKLPLIEQAVRLEESVGDLFTLVLQPGVKLTPNARAFVLKHAQAIVNGTKVDNLGLDTWMVMLSPTDSIHATPVEWSTQEKEVLQSAQGYPANSLKRFVKGPGLGKYFEYLRLRLMAA